MDFPSFSYWGKGGGVGRCTLTEEDKYIFTKMEQNCSRSSDEHNSKLHDSKLTFLKKRQKEGK